MDENTVIVLAQHGKRKIIWISHTNGRGSIHLIKDGRKVAGTSVTRPRCCANYLESINFDLFDILISVKFEEISAILLYLHKRYMVYVNEERFSQLL